MKRILLCLIFILCRHGLLADEKLGLRQLDLIRDLAQTQYGDQNPKETVLISSFYYLPDDVLLDRVMFICLKRPDLIYDAILVYRWNRIFNRWDSRYFKLSQFNEAELYYLLN